MVLKAKRHGNSPELVRKTEVEIQKTEKEIAVTRKEQNVQFKALSIEDQRRMCAVVGLEHLERACSTTDETLPAVDALGISDESFVKPASISGEETSKQAERSAGAANLSKPPNIQTNLSGYATSMHVDEQAGHQWGGGGTVQMPHKRVEALRGLTVSQPRPHNNQTPLQQASRSLDEGQTLMRPQAKPYPWSGTAEIDELLRQNQERQQSLISELRSSKENILQMQENSRRAEEAEGGTQPRVNIDLEAFLRERDVG